MEVKKIRNIVGSLFVLSLFSICFHTFLIIIVLPTTIRSWVTKAWRRVRVTVRVTATVRDRVTVTVRVRVTVTVRDRVRVTVRVTVRGGVRARDRVRVRFV